MSDCVSMSSSSRGSLGIVGAIPACAPTKHVLERVSAKLIRDQVRRRRADTIGASGVRLDTIVSDGPCLSVLQTTSISCAITSGTSPGIVSVAGYTRFSQEVYGLLMASDWPSSESTISCRTPYSRPSASAVASLLTSKIPIVCELRLNAVRYVPGTVEHQLSSFVGTQNVAEPLLGSRPKLT